MQESLLTQSMSSSKKIIPLTLDLSLHPFQTQVDADPSRFKYLLCGRRWGKSVLLAWNMVKSCSKPNSTVWYLTNQLKQAKDIVWREILTILGPSRSHFKANETNLEITWDNGSVINIKGSKEPDCRRGPALDLLAIDEAQDFDGEDFMTIFRPLLSGRQGKAIIAGTKKHGSWFLSEWKSASRGEIPMAKAFWFSSTTNPIIPPQEWQSTKEYLRQKGRLDIWENEYVCDPLSRAGKSVDLKFWEFEFSKHVCQPSVLAEGSRIFCGMDWGMSDKHPTVVLWGALSQSGRLTIFDELILYGEDPANAVARILEKNAAVKPEGYVLDESCWSKETDGKNLAQRLTAEGVGTLIKASREDRKHSKAGLVKSWLRPSKGSPRIQIFSTCKYLINELQSLRWENRTGDDSTDALIYLTNFISIIVPSRADKDAVKETVVPFKPFILKLDIPRGLYESPSINPDTGYFT